MTPLLVTASRLAACVAAIAAGALLGGPVGLAVIGVACLASGAVVWKHAVRWPRSLEIATWTGYVFAGAVFGSQGVPGIAVLAAVPASYVGAAPGPFAAAAVGGLAGAIVGGNLSAGAAFMIGVSAAVGWWAMLAGRAAASADQHAESERLELDGLRAEMVSTVSHELRTPLTVIQAATATLNRRWDVLTESERLDLIDVLTDNAASLDASILHFVDAARLEHGGVVIAPQSVDLAATIEDARDARMAALAGHPVVADLELAEVWADPTCLLRIVEHLLINAARFSPIGSPITIRSSYAPVTGEVVIRVSDRGQGIPPHIQATVWDPLRRGGVTDTGISRGAGLGLSIVRELARLHGGDASLTSTRGRGTTVSVSLPLPAPVRRSA